LVKRAQELGHEINHLQRDQRRVIPSRHPEAEDT
jgi:hypothetical protein